MSATPEEGASEGALPEGTLVTHRRWLRVGWRAATRRFELIAALDGSVWVLGDIASRRSAHFVVRLERQVRRYRQRRHRPQRPARVVWQETAITFGEGTLTDVSPASDARGVSLVVERDGLEELIGYRNDELHSLRRGDIVRCF